MHVKRVLGGGGGGGGGGERKYSKQTPKVKGAIKNFAMNGKNGALK